MLLSRILVGFGSGNVAVMRTYGANASVKKDRAKAITMVTACWVCGITVGPAIQVAFAPIGYPGVKLFGALHLDMYTAPPLLAALIDLLVLVLLNVFVKEEYVGVVDEKKVEDPFYALPKPKLLPIIVCIVTRFTLMFTITNAEAIGSMFVMAMYKWTNAEAVKYNGMIMLGQSGVSLIVNILFTVKLADYISNGKERITATLGLVIGLLYHVITYAWPFFPNRLDYRIDKSNGTIEYVGCYPSKYSWCSHTHQVPLWLYAFATVFILGLALYVTFTPLNTLFSKVLGDRRQGTMTGIFFMAGSVARTIGPIVVAVMFENYGPEITWILPIIMLAITVLLWIICWKQIVPLDSNPKLKAGESYKYDNGNKYKF
uniref:Uncharacterized protein n=1 Tax=Acrobeloides nanus TaxID=290746 RepID=A0A914DWI0_9BILA